MWYEVLCAKNDAVHAWTSVVASSIWQFGRNQKAYIKYITVFLETLHLQSTKCICCMRSLLQMSGQHSENIKSWIQIDFSTPAISNPFLFCVRNFRDLDETRSPSQFWWIRCKAMSHVKTHLFRLKHPSASASPGGDTHPRCSLAQNPTKPGTFFWAAAPQAKFKRPCIQYGLQCTTVYRVYRMK